MSNMSGVVFSCRECKHALQKQKEEKGSERRCSLVVAAPAPAKWCRQTTNNSVKLWGVAEGSFDPAVVGANIC